MKVSFHEYGGHWHLNLNAETVAEAAQLVRLGVNRLPALKSADTIATSDGKVEHNLIIGKRKNNTPYIPQAK